MILINPRTRVAAMRVRGMCYVCAPVLQVGCGFSPDVRVLARFAVSQVLPCYVAKWWRSERLQFHFHVTDDTRTHTPLSSRPSSRYTHAYVLLRPPDRERQRAFVRHCSTSAKMIKSTSQRPPATHTHTLSRCCGIFGATQRDIRVGPALPLSACISILLPGVLSPAQTLTHMYTLHQLRRAQPSPLSQRGLRLRRLLQPHQSLSLPSVALGTPTPPYAPSLPGGVVQGGKGHM